MTRSLAWGTHRHQNDHAGHATDRPQRRQRRLPGGREQTASQMLTARDNQRVATEAAARALAVGAEALTTDGATLQSGGWELQAARAPVGQLPQPANLDATGGDLEGTVDLPVNLNVGQRVSPARVSAGNPLGRRDALPYVDALRRGVQTYIAQQALSPSGPWTQCYVGKASSCTVTGLTSGTQYWFQVSAIGAAGLSPWSDPATKRTT